MRQESTSDAIAEWRRTILERALWTAAIVILFAIAAVVIQRPASGFLLATRLLLGEVVLAVALAWRRGSTSLRASVLVLGFGLVVASAALERGFMLPNAMTGGLLLCVLAALIVSKRATWATVASLLLLWAIIAMLFVAGRKIPDDTYMDLAQPGNWVRVLVVYGAVVMGATGSVLFFTTRLEKALRREQALHAALLHEAEQKLAAQRQLQQAQKMESLGRLAGGLAHDFNNLLLVIVASAETAADSDEVGRESARQDILTAAARAAALTRQLLGFSRQQPLDVGALDVAASATATLGFVRRLLPESIVVNVDIPTSLPPCWGPVTTVEQVLMNLVVNARDAMPAGGELFVSASRVERMPPARDDGERARPYVMLRVRDTGAGMDGPTLHHAFDPFFTTKGASQGTGLGLSIVQGLAERCGGFVDVQSTPRGGTTFDVYLATGGRKMAGVESLGRPAFRTREASDIKVLVVDDDESVRRVLVDTLRRARYHVAEARDGLDGIAVFTAQGGVDVVVTDVVMPHMSGEQMITRMKEQRLDTAVLVCSGYTAEMFDHGFFEHPMHMFLSKPFRPSELLEALERLLARAPAVRSEPAQPYPDAPPNSGRRRGAT